jgi:hypothetical protein
VVTSPPKSPDWRNAWFCAGIVLAAIALTVPIAESGVNDDWSYTKTALDLAQTGHLLYNGWSAAMLGAQAWWGALFIKLFGFSFLAVRLSVTPLAAGCAALLYGLHRRASLPPGLALFGALTIVLSPVFIPNAASFMTEIPALFLFLASIYGYVRVADVLDAAERADEPPASRRNRLWGWLLFGLSTGLLGGTVRQTDWLVPMFAPGFLLMRRRTLRRLRPALVPLAVSSLVALSGAAAFSAWFKDQPYAVHEKVFIGVNLLFTSVEAPAILCLWLVLLMQTLGVLMLPLLITLPMLYRRWLAGQRLPWLRLGGALFLTLFIWFLACQCCKRDWVFSWLGNTFSLQPYQSDTALAPPDSIPTTLPMPVWNAVELAVTALVCGMLALWVAAHKWPRQKNTGEQPRDRMPVVIGLLIVFSAAYVPLLLLKVLVPYSYGIWDRYLLPVFPLATMGFLLLFRQWTGRDQLPLASWFVLVLFGFYGVAQAHDYFAQLRARLAVTQYLEQLGIPRTHIMAGFEYDGWTQLEVAGHYNDPRIGKPAGIFVPSPKSPGFVTIYAFWRYTPVVHPDYVVALVRHPELLATDVPPTGFSCWLPPIHRRLQVQVSDPALAAVGRLPARPALPAATH